ncbi:MAG: hypothetical protein ABI193_12575 [Minicystis sp.]
MANEKDPPAPVDAPPPLPVEGATKQFTLKMSSWLTDLASDLAAPAGAPAITPDAPIDALLEPDPPKPGEEAARDEEATSLEAALFKSEFPPKP